MNVMKNNLFFIFQFTSTWNIFISVMKQIILSKRTRIYSWSQKYRSFWVLHTYYYFIQNIQYGRIYLWSTVRVNNIPRKRRLNPKKRKEKLASKWWEGRSRESICPFVTRNIGLAYSYETVSNNQWNEIVSLLGRDLINVWSHIKTDERHGQKPVKIFEAELTVLANNDVENGNKTMDLLWVGETINNVSFNTRIVRVFIYLVYNVVWLKFTLSIHHNSLNLYLFNCYLNLSLSHRVVDRQLRTQELKRMKIYF